MSILAEIGKLFIDLDQKFDSTLAKGTLTMNQVVQETRQLTDYIAREHVREYVQKMDDRLLASEVRKRNFTIERRHQEKTLATTAGPLVYERSYFKDKRDGRYICLIDQMLGIEPHQRISQELAVSLLESAKDTSYRMTADRYAHTGISSPTAVMGLVHRHGRIESSELPAPEKKCILRLYIEADEDHVAMQDGTNQMMKLVYVHEGYQRVGKKRNALVNPRFFTGLYKGSSDELWYEVLTYLDAAYDLDKVEEITLSGDGAPWIKMGAQILPKSRFYLDKYHLEKALRKAASPIDALKRTDEKYYWYLKDAISMDSKDDVRVYFDSALGLPLMTSQIKAITESCTYILSNWEAIQNAQQTGYHGCSAEGHVSHVLSSRLSSRPMGWSELGAENIARLRVFALNGGDCLSYFSAKDKAKKKEARIVQLEKRLLKKSKVYPVKEGSINYATPHFSWYKSQ